MCKSRKSEDCLSRKKMSDVITSSKTVCEGKFYKLKAIIAYGQQIPLKICVTIVGKFHSFFVKKNL